MASLYTRLIFFASSLFRLNLPAGAPVTCWLQHHILYTYPPSILAEYKRRTWLTSHHLMSPAVLTSKCRSQNQIISPGTWTVHP